MSCALQVNAQPITMNRTKQNDMKNNILKYGLLAFMWLAFSLPALAQFDSPGDPPTDEDPIPTPIDSWMLLLVMAGIAIGAYLIIKYNRKAMAQ